MSRTMRRGAVAALIQLAIAMSVGAGPLDPVVGPLTGTSKPLSEVEPRGEINAANTPGDADSLYRIAQPGSYDLTGNIAGVNAKRGIEIAASGVTIDLMGFTMTGAAQSAEGIGCDGQRGRITIRNGVIFGWNQGIVLTTGATGATSTIEGVQALSNAGAGIVSNHKSIIRDCIVRTNMAGISTGVNSNVQRCAAHDNTSAGFAVGSDSMVIGCAASGNGSGFLGSESSSFIDCIANENMGPGFTVVAGLLQSCAASGNQLMRISAVTLCTVIGCVAHDNDAAGIDCGSGCLVDSCAAAANRQSGIQCDGHCAIRNNVLSSNGSGAIGAGIHVTGDSNRIEGNQCTSADRGIDVDGTSNIIVRNTCSQNIINWNIVANNYFGTVVNRLGVATPALSGDASASTLGSTDANSNFTH